MIEGEHWYDKHLGEILVGLVGGLVAWLVATGRRVLGFDHRISSLEEDLEKHLSVAEPLMLEFHVVKHTQALMQKTLDFLVTTQLEHYHWVAEQARDSEKAAEIARRLEVVRSQARRAPDALDEVS